MRKLIPLILVLGILINSDVNSQTNTLSESISSKQLQAAYHDDAVHINVNGDVVNGAESISSFWLNQEIESVTSTLIFETNAVYKDDIIYKIESFNLGEKNEQTHLLIVQNMGDHVIRKLEFISKRVEADIDLSIIDQRRAEWIEYCNAHDASGLVENLYTENAIYYNHRPVKVGREALTQEYKYMNSPRYSLNLTPLHVEVVSDSIIYEIGQCDGSYNGKYMLVWQKGEDGTWNILMDSNI